MTDCSQESWSGVEGATKYKTAGDASGMDFLLGTIPPSSEEAYFFFPFFFFCLKKIFFFCFHFPFLLLRDMGNGQEKGMINWVPITRAAPILRCAHPFSQCGGKENNF